MHKIYNIPKASITKPKTQQKIDKKKASNKKKTTNPPQTKRRETTKKECLHNKPHIKHCLYPVERLILTMCTVK